MKKGVTLSVKIGGKNIFRGQRGGQILSEHMGDFFCIGQQAGQTFLSHVKGGTRKG